MKKATKINYRKILKEYALHYEVIIALIGYLILSIIDWKIAVAIFFIIESKNFKITCIKLIKK